VRAAPSGLTGAPAAAIDCADVHYSFGEHVALAGLSLRVERGEMFGLLGPNGAGKTTAIRILNTMLPLQRGAMSVFGHDLRREQMSVRRLIGYVPQQLSIEAALTGRQNVAWFARLFDVPRRQRRARVDEALESVGLTDSAERLAGTYSGGMVRRLELAQAVVNRPALLVLDEPTIGLDPVARDGVWRHVEELRRQTNMTVFLTTHYMEEADALCDRVALMHLGSIRALASPSDLKAALGPGATLDTVFRHHSGGALDGTTNVRGGLKDVRSRRSTAS
jgi:ABC-2 type transport system ATP-binding protein